MSQSPGGILAELGRRYGRDMKLVQAAGGNVSLKTSPHRMIIKTSGARLREMTTSFGWAAADHQVIRTHLEKIARLRSFRAREMSYVKLLQKATRSTGSRISMEAGFHAILPEAYVLHLHSLAGILLGMMPQEKAQTLIDQACQGQAEASFAPAKLPGFELTYRMLQGIKQNHGKKIQLWIQRNHGVVWSGPDKESLIKIVQIFERHLRVVFRLNDFPFPHAVGSIGCASRAAARLKTKSVYAVNGAICFCRWPKCSFVLEPLFPDFVIYFNLWNGMTPDVVKAGPRVAVIRAKTRYQWKDKKEVMYAHALVSTIAKSHGWYVPLPGPMIGQLKAMETERLRMAQILKS